MSFAEGLMFRRLEMLVERRAPAVAPFSGPYYFAEQLGFRKIIDTTFMIATMIHGDPDPEDLQVLPRLAPRAARPRPAPRPLHALLQERIPRALPPADGHPPLGPGERLVFEPYTKEAHAETVDRIRRHGIFDEGGMGHGRYEDSVVSLAA